MSIFGKPKPKPVEVIQQPQQPKDRRFAGGAVGGTASTLGATGGRGTFLGG